MPNEETIAAMKEARRGKLRRHASSADMLKSLDEDD
jgi:hypothetical protein